MHLRAKQAYLGEYKTLPVCSVFNVEKRSDQNVRPGKRIRCLGQIVGFSHYFLTYFMVKNGLLYTPGLPTTLKSIELLLTVGV